MWPARRLAPFRRSRANGCVCSVRAVLSCSPACPIPARPATTRSRPPVRHFAAVALSGPPRPAGSVAEISFFTTYPVGDGIAPVERLSADRHAWWPGPARMPAIQCSFAEAQFAGELFRRHVFGKDCAGAIERGRHWYGGSCLSLWCHFRRASRNIQRRVLHNRALWPALAICLSAGGHNSANYVRLGGAKKLTSEQKPHRNALGASRNRSTKSLVPSKIRVACPRRLINISWDIVRAIN
jgi:hypothetical protein